MRAVLVRFLVASVALAVWAAGGTAMAAVPNVDIGAAPLSNVSVGNELSCQVKHTGDSQLEFYPSGTTPGDCGTFIAAGGTVYGPDFKNHGGTATGSVTSGGYTPFSAVSQSAKSGSGTSSNPFKVVTTVNVGGTGLQITQTDSYIAGQEAYRTDITIRNGGGGAVSGNVYRAADCYLQNSDSGFGFTGPNNAVGCSANANNSPPGRIEEWVPITPGNNFLEDGYSQVWSAIATKNPFPNLCVHCGDQIDNGAGISWAFSLQPGESVTFSHFTTFSPTGAAGPPPAGSDDLAAAKTPRCLSISGVVRNRVGKVPGGSVTLKTRQVDNPARPLNLSVSGKGVTIASVSFLVNGRPVTGTRSASVLVTLLKIGSKFKNRIVAVVVLSNGRTVRLTQFMVILKCHVPKAACKRLSGNKRLRCTSKTPLGGRRVFVTVTKSASETAKGGPAKVTKGRYTIIVVSKVALSPGVYAYKAIVRTNKRGEKFQMIRLVTVK